MPTQAPAEAVHICNLALELFAEHVIAGIEIPRNEAEKRMARWYDHVRRVVLRENPWNFASRFAELARAGDGAGDWSDAYNLPNDWVRLNSIGRDKKRPLASECYDMGDGQIYANKGSSLAIWYNYDVIDVLKMDALFIHVLAIRLAMLVAFSFTKKKSSTEALAALLKMEEPKALSVDGQEKKPIRIQQSKYLAAHRGSRVRSNPLYYDFSDD